MDVLSPFPEFEFVMSRAADPGEPRRFVDALIGTGKWWRCERSMIHYKRAEGDYVRIDAGRAQLAEILRDGECLRMIGTLDQAAIDCLWSWLLSRKWSLPRLNPGVAYNPDRPRPQYGAVGPKPMSPVRR